MEKSEVEGLKRLVKEALTYTVEFKPTWGINGARELYQLIPSIRGICARLEEIMFQLELVRVKIKEERRNLKLDIENKQDMVVEASFSKHAGSGMSWEERGSLRRVGVIDQRMRFNEVTNELAIIDAFYEAVDKRYRLFLGSKADAQAMVNLLRVGGILGELD